MWGFLGREGRKNKRKINKNKQTKKLERPHSTEDTVARQKTEATLLVLAVKSALLRMNVIQLALKVH